MHSFNALNHIQIQLVYLDAVYFADGKIYIKEEVFRFRIPGLDIFFAKLY